MERLLFAFVLIGTTLACSPVPEPKVKGKGHDVVYVTLVTNKTYNPAGISTFLSDFSETKIQQYSASVGNFSDLNCTNTDGYFTWTFKLTDANCTIVKAWVNQIVNSSSFYQYGETSCSKACSPVPEPKVKGKGNDIVYVYVVTNQTYNPAGISQFLSAFSGTEIQQYSASLGDFSDLNYYADSGRYFTWTFTLTNASCSIVLIENCGRVAGANPGELVVLLSRIFGMRPNRNTNIGELD
nr:unnamed protein product [Haemonchus contortus]